MLIHRAEINFGEIVDLRIDNGVIAEIAPSITARPEETVIDAAGAALLPGLCDHHLHLRALSAAAASVRCGPPDVTSAAALAESLREAPGEGWIRGIGYHESVAGEIDRDWLDAHAPARPLRVQHRSGRLWILNSPALEELALDSGSGDPLERVNGRNTGRLYDADDWLRQRLRGRRQNLSELSCRLASWGVTAVTDTTHSNSLVDFQAFAEARARSELLQDILVMGDASLDAAADGAGIFRGAHKFHLHDAELPDFDVQCHDIERAHAAGRGAAFHCVSEGELVFALAALREVGPVQGDRVEHAGIAPPPLVEQMAQLGVTAVTQPNFIFERGDAYLSEVEQALRPWLYRLRGLLEAGIPLAGSTDAPFGEPDPWAAMQAAVDRRTRGGSVVGPAEALSPEQALALFMSPLRRPWEEPTRLAGGLSADLCLLRQPWARVRGDLRKVRVRLTLKGGNLIWSSANDGAG